MGQAITDYVKFLADARDAVYRLNCDQNTAGQLADEDNASEEPGACLVWHHFLLRSVLPQRGQGDYDFPSYPGNLLSGNSMRYLFYDSPEGYLVFGGGVFCGCHFVWRALCGDWQ